jgi:peptidoglycan pentaglycine glycine transferase (the first glycine)
MGENKYEFRDVVSRQEWNQYILTYAYPSYFQSWNWGEVEKTSRSPIERIGIYQKDNLVGLIQITEVHSKRGHFLRIRQGPLMHDWSPESIKTVISYLKKLAREKGASFIRMSTLLPDTAENRGKFAHQGLIYAPTHNQDGENRWVLLLAKSEDELLSGMRKTTRYMVKRAQTSNIKVERTNSLYKIKDFLAIYNETTQIKSFVAHKSIAQEFEEFSRDNQAFLYFAYEGTKLLASAFIAYCGTEAIYRHGATSAEGRKSPASYLIQWEAIKDAKKKGLMLYDFWGIAENDDPKHPWYGLSNFKKGFGGERLDFLHTFDIPVSPLYLLTYGVDFVTTVKKGYGIPNRLRVQ